MSNQNGKLKIFSTFSGIGGFELGIENALGKENIEIVGISEIDKYAVNIYEKHYPKHINFGDITRIKAKDLPYFDMLCGGFPCQDLSIAGKRAGLTGKRSGLFYEIIRIAEEKQPYIILLENVKGLLNSSKGWDFANVLLEMDGIGYDIEWQLLNSKDFGVPQNRERVFIIGHLRGKPWKPVFSIGENSGEDDEVQRDKKEKRTWVPCLSTRYGQRWTDEGYIKQRLKIEIPSEQQDNRVYNSEGLSPCLDIRHKPKIITHSLYPRSGNPKQGGTGHLSKEDGSSYCLDCGNMQAIETKSSIRRLTPIECERLQAFPDNWTQYGADGKLISNTQRYKCLGNSITTSVVEEIVKRMEWK